MAKKANKELSLEEKLQNALVADWEQPYALPENWVWTRLGEVAEYKKGPFGSSITKSMFVPKGENTFKIYEQGNAIQKNENYGSYYITKEKFLELQSFNIQKKDIIVSCAGTIGEIFEIPEKHEAGIINQALMRIRIKKNVCKLFYLNYFSGIIHSDIESKSKGTAIKNIPPFSILKNIPFPLPPLAEQERIVQRIESLFAKLDTAKELLEEALESFESRKSALLHQAFTGELTKRHSGNALGLINGLEAVKTDLIRKKTIQKQKVTPIQNNEKKYCIPNNWEFIKLGDGAFVTKLAGFEYTKHINLKETGEIPVIRAQNIRKGYLDTRNLMFIDSETSHALPRSALTKESILITFIGAGIGDVCVFNEKNRFHLAPNVAKVEIYNSQTQQFILSDFLLYFLLSLNGQNELFKHLKSVAQPSLSMEAIRDIVIPIAPLSEQEEIVRILDAQLQKEGEAKAHIQHSLEHIEHMKKAVLARAFRGELGTNNPEEANAVELLKEILEKAS